MTDTKRLKALIAESGIKLKVFCDKMNISYATLSRKIENEYEFTASEIETISVMLHLTLLEKNEIFFAKQCQPH